MRSVGLQPYILRLFFARDSGVCAEAPKENNPPPGARRIPGEFVSGDYFRLFGVQPVLGRLPSRADDVRGCPATTVLTYGYWQRVSRSLR